MEANIAADPSAYPVIPGTGGFRKARWSRGSSGKSGGVRAIFYCIWRHRFLHAALCKERIGEFDT